MRFRQVMLDFAKAAQAVMQLQQAPSGLLRSSAPIGYGELWHSSALGEFMRPYPLAIADVREDWVCLAGRKP